MTEPFLIGDAMTGGYGRGADILHDCTIAVNPGEIAVIVGPNGAGKSTAMKAVFGMLNIHKGSVRLDGEEITHLSPQDRVAKGMAFVPQTSNIFTSLTVEGTANAQGLGLSALFQLVRGGHACSSTRSCSSNLTTAMLTKRSPKQ